jgi:hypothetical protein
VDATEVQTVLLAAQGADVDLTSVNARAFPYIMAIAGGRLLHSEHLSDQAIGVVLAEAEVVADQLKRIRETPQRANGVNDRLPGCAAAGPASRRRYPKRSGR